MEIFLSVSFSFTILDVLAQFTNKSANQTKICEIRRKMFDYSLSFLVLKAHAFPSSLQIIIAYMCWHFLAFARASRSRAKTVFFEFLHFRFPGNRYPGVIWCLAFSYWANSLANTSIFGFAQLSARFIVFMSS